MKLQLQGAVTLVLLSSGSLFADSFSQVNLVSDITGLAAQTDTNLKDPWGIAFSTTSPLWVADRASGVATVYTGSGSKIALVVTVPPGTATTGPTGQVFAGPGTAFRVNGGSAGFLFDTLGGTIDA